MIINFNKKILFSALLVIQSLCNAQQETLTNKKNLYLQFNTGVANGLAPKGEFGNKKMGYSPAIGLELGYQINPKFRTSLSLDYLTGFSFTNSATEHTYDAEEQIEADEYESIKYKVRSISLMLNAYYDIADINGFKPYLLAGIGYSNNQAKASGIWNGTDGVDRIDGNLCFNNNGKNSFAYKFGLGTRYTISNTIDLDLRYQYVNLGKFSTGLGTESSPYLTQYKNSQSNGKLKTNQFLLGILYKF